MYIKPKVVVIGGGTGLSVLLRGLKHFPLSLTAIVTVADDGGSSGLLRQNYNIPAPGDLRNVMVALGESEPVLEKLFQYRFGKDLDNHALGNLLIAGMLNITGDIVSAVKNLSKVLNVKGKILPSTAETPILVAEFEDGSFIEGESKIPQQNKKIKNIYLKKKVKAVKETIKAIEEADFVIFGIGSLYTSIIPNILIEEIKQALIESRAKKYYICNAMQQPGETKGYSVSDHVLALDKYIGKSIINTVFSDKTDVELKILEKYLAEGVKKVEIDKSKLNEMKLEVIESHLIEIENNQVRHKPYKLASVIYSKILEEYMERGGFDV